MKYLGFIILLAVNLAFGLFTSASAEMGGISGGGGGTTRPVPATKEQIAQAVEQSKVIISAWLYQEEYIYKKYGKGLSNVPEDEAVLLFDGAIDVYKKMNNLNIEVRMNEACYDANNIPVDGSIVANPPASICISAKRLSEKLTDYNHEAETAALIVHEIVHLLRGAEDTARNLQKKALYAILKTPSQRYKFDLSNKVAVALEVAHRQFARTQGAITQAAGLCGMMSHLAETYGLISEDFPTGLLGALVGDNWNLFPVDAMTQDRLNQMVAILTGVQDYTCSNDSNLAESERLMNKARYERIFGNQTIISATEFLARRFGGPGQPINDISGLTVRRIQSQADLENEFQKVKSILLPTQVAIEDLIVARFQVIRH